MPLWIDFSTIRNAFINTQAQIHRTGRQIAYRMQLWNRWQSAFFRLFEAVWHPL